MSKRTPFIAGNWKMHLEEWAAVELAGSIAEGLSDHIADVAVFPPFPWLVPVAAVLQGSRVALGAQDCSAEKAGPYTGQVSASMLNGLCRFVIVGHSERRRDCCESNELIGRKAVAAIEAGITPIVCVGESSEVRAAGKAVHWVTEQVSAVIDAVGNDRLDRLVFAYEPIWAIGTGTSASADDAEEIAVAIRDHLAKANQSAAPHIRILYGGSATPANATEFLSKADVDGLLIGGSCLRADSFLEIVAAADELAG